ncbi:YihY/virulence factor BrkB family protein [Acetobacterium tundrae]|uniref:YihY family inner membrane protein n=1 Tax=Acetobacterium tundrae TaxID=132932 RepID=A0ABR6WK47_9FIRM|nr:YihY/virulence factor BrkB family protein [Acetobacterium tundrae]MBC3796883.1 YihY family inner membrane protein [Acetobacterium tundrae]
MKNKRTLELLKDLYARFTNDDLLSVGAQVTYFLLLSLPPFLIFLITFLTFTPMVDFQSNIDIIATLMPANVYEIFREIINQTIANRSGTLLSFGIIFALWSSAGGVAYLIRGINRAYNQEETRPFLKLKAVSLAITLALTFTIIFSMILIVFGRILGTQIFHFLGFSDIFLKIWSYFRLIIALIAIIFVLIFLYYSAPNRRMRFKEVLPGAIIASISWVIVSFAFSFYANNLGNYTAVYGSLGGIFALLTWIYLSSIIILLGAEINASLIFSKTGIKKEKFKRF